MKLLINASTLSATGATQVAVSFINECKGIPEHSYYVLMSKKVSNQVETKQFPTNFTFVEIPSHPRLIFKGYLVRKKIRIFEREIKPDCVFSVFGPSFWTPRSPHLMGYAYPHYVYPDSPLFKIIGLKDWIRINIYKLIHFFFLKRNGSYYVCETEDVSKRLIKYFGVNKERVFTVSNTYNHHFNSFEPSHDLLLRPREKNEFRFLSLCSLALHKNLEVLNQVIPIIQKKITNHKVYFILTVDEILFKSKFSEVARSSIINLGRIDISLCPQLYYECDSLFLPTLLECFSANYPEAMKMRKPILTSDLSFSTAICGPAALYFNPLDPDDIVENIEKILNDEVCRINLVENGLKRLSIFNTPQGRAQSYLNICKSIINA